MMKAESAFLMHELATRRASPQRHPIGQPSWEDGERVVRAEEGAQRRKLERESRRGEERDRDPRCCVAVYSASSMSSQNWRSAPGKSPPNV